MNRVVRPLVLVTLWLPLAAVVAGPAAFGQETAEQRRRSHGPLSNRSVDSRLLNERFQAAQWLYQAQEPWRNPESRQKLLERALGKRNLSPEDLKALENLVDSLQREKLPLKPNDPLVEQLQRLSQLRPMTSSGMTLNPNTMNRLDRLLRELAEKNVAAGSEPGPGSNPAQPAGGPAQESNGSESGAGSSSGGEVPGSSSPEPPGGKSDNNDLAQWFLKKSDWLANHSEALQNSSAWQSAVGDLAKYAAGGGSYRLGAPQESWEEGLARRMDSYMPSTSFWNDKVLPRLNRIPIPSLPQVRLPRIDLSRTSLPSVDVPRVALPSVSGARTRTGFLGMVGAAVLAFVLWHLYRFWPRRAPRGSAAEHADPHGWDLGPWTGTPLAGREDLVRAFEQVSVQKLGPEVRSWNHRVIAAGLGKGDLERGQVARHLASLYERARYAPANESLPDGALQMAYRELSFLAGIAAV